MNVVIIEDEKPAAARLQTLINRYDPDIRVIACLESIEESVLFLKTKSHPDLLLADIHLSDGHCFEIFKQIEYKKPVVFTTAYDNYLMEAFRFVSIDYILKPVSQEALAGAITKLKNMSAQFAVTDVKSALSQLDFSQYKKRFLGKVGQRLFFLDVDKISFFQADNKVVYLFDKEGNKYTIDYTMEKLEQLLNPADFFRINRSFIVSHHSISHLKNFANNRLKLILDNLNCKEELIVSREKVVDFKSWAEM